MAHFLGLALVAEGPTDQRFFRPLLRRMAERVCAAEAMGIVEIPDVLELVPSPPNGDLPHVERVKEQAMAAYNGWHILFVHSDGAGDPAGAAIERVEPIREALSREAGAHDRRVVEVIPVREMEAWAIADGDAVRAAFGTTRTNAELGLPDRPADVERVLDPKKTLAQALATAAGGRRRRRTRTTSAFLDLIAEQLDLSVLEQVPSFARTRTAFVTALRELGLLAPVQ